MNADINLFEKLIMTCMKNRSELVINVKYFCN
jgi:hypothetical protein